MPSSAQLAALIRYKPFTLTRFFSDRPLSGGNLTATVVDPNATSFFAARVSKNDGTMPTFTQAGKKYIEFVLNRSSGNGTASGFFGLWANALVSGVDGTITANANPFGINVYSNCGPSYFGINIGYITNGTNVANAAYAFAYGDVIGIAVDFSTGNIWYSKNGSWIAGDPVAGTGPTHTIPNANYQFGMAVYTKAELNATYPVTCKSAALAQTYAAPSGYTAYG